MSMVFQEPMTSLNPVHTVGNQIIEAIRLHRRMSSRQARGRAIELLELVGIPSPERRVDAFPHQMSGGMRQRVMIAMALACEPKLLIADEPTTALDVTIQAQILELLRQLRDRLAMAVILITHDLGVVAEMCDDVAVMYAGAGGGAGLRRSRLPQPAASLHRGIAEVDPAPGNDEGRAAQRDPRHGPERASVAGGLSVCGALQLRVRPLSSRAAGDVRYRLGIRSLLATQRYCGAITAGSNRRCMNRCCTPVASRNTSP